MKVSELIEELKLCEDLDVRIENNVYVFSDFKIEQGDNYVYLVFDETKNKFFQHMKKTGTLLESTKHDNYFGRIKLALYHDDENVCETVVLPDFIQDIFNEVASLSSEYKILSAAYFEKECEHYDVQELIYQALFKAKNWYKEGVDEFKK